MEKRKGTCLTCGTCCFSASPEYVRVLGSDYARMDERAPELVLFVGNRAFMRMEEGHCKALVLDAMRATFTCSIYEIRPDTCRDLEEGSRECEGEIMTKGERPEAALIALGKRPSA